MRKNKSLKLLIILSIFALLVLSACKDLPPSPPPLGEPGIGKAIVGMATGKPTWAAEPKGITLTPPEVKLGEGLVVSVTNFNFIFSKAYFFDSVMREWRPFSLSGEKIDSWIKNSALGAITVKKSSFKPGDNFIVVYACNKAGRKWDCNGRRWMLAKFTVKEEKVKKITGADKYIISKTIMPFELIETGGEPDDFEGIPNTRYDARYKDAETGLIVVAHVFNFANKQDLDKAINTVFKEIYSRGYQNYQGNGIGVFLDQENRRVATWPSGLNIVYIETYTPAFANKEIIEAYLNKYPSDLRK